MGKKFFIIFGILFFAVTAFAGEWSTRYNGHTRKQDWIRGDDPVFSGTLTTGSLLIDGTLPDDLYVNITGDTMTGQLQATTLTDGTLIITDGDLTTIGDVSCKDVIVSGSVDGIDVAGMSDFVVLNSAHRNDNTQAHTDYMRNVGDITTGDYNFTAGDLTTTGTGYFGNLRIGSTVAPTVALDVTGYIKASKTISTSEDCLVGNMVGIGDLNISQAGIIGWEGEESNLIIDYADGHEEATSLIIQHNAVEVAEFDGDGDSKFTGNVRIGSTVAPTVALDVTGDVLVSGTLTATDLIIGGMAVDEDTYVPYTGANTTVNLNSQNLVTSGGISIGTTNPSSKLDVVSSTSGASENLSKLTFTRSGGSINTGYTDKAMDIDITNNHDFTGLRTAILENTYGQDITVTDNGDFNSLLNAFNRNVYGVNIEASNLGVQISPMQVTYKNTYGVKSVATNTGVLSGGSMVSAYGGYFQGIGDSSARSTAYGIYATATGANTNYAGYFQGGVTVAGTLTATLVVNATDYEDMVGINNTAPSVALDVTGAIASGTLIHSTTGVTDNLDITGVNTVFVDTTNGDITLGGLVGGVDGQYVFIVKIVAANDLTLEHLEGVGGDTDDFFMHQTLDEIIDAGGVPLVFDGVTERWFDISHAKHT